MAVDVNSAIKSIQDVASLIAKASKWIVGFGFLIILAAVVLRQFGVSIPFVPTMAHESIAYYAGAYWLITARFS